ncbi:hypothetical protein CR983_01160 [Candidatus Saccharibacteria bacterium]|nr:MAG: hypothetical protein CR983_01160 [Candidatus Saccharibacteria bacterium]
MIVSKGINFPRRSEQKGTTHMYTPKPSEVFPRRAETPPDDASQPSSTVGYTLAKPETFDAPERKSDSLAQPEVEYCLGSPELPIASYREQIVESVANHQATIITAETGAGKSTQVPQFLAEAGLGVVVTQPRIVAARSVAAHVQKEVTARMGDDFERYVGYRTAQEHGDSPENQILFVTDGLQEVRELAGHGIDKEQVLILDEVHEWNENMEVLVAWSKKRMAEDPNFKVVVMSATMESRELADYYSANGTRDVPLIEVPGRVHDVKKDESGFVSDKTIEFARQGKNTLVFAPGKNEIYDIIAEIDRAKIPGLTVLPLYAAQEPEEQNKVFGKYPGTKVVVATNIAQTSITIDDIDAVVDSGLERRKEVFNGVEGLYIRQTSQADCLQRAGRAGRTKAGEYVLARLGSIKHTAFRERDTYGTPEILRTLLDGTVLRLAKNGFDVEEFGFFHQPDQEDITNAKNRLKKLGALDNDNRITKIGRDMERLPVRSNYARMIIESHKYSPAVQSQLAAILAIQEAGGILRHLRGDRKNEKWRSAQDPSYNDSDMIKQLEVFIAYKNKRKGYLNEHDILVKAFNKSKEVMKSLRRVEQLNGEPLLLPTAQQREQLVKCIVAGMVDSLFLGEGSFSAYTGYGQRRICGNRSTIEPSEMIVGTPYDLEVPSKSSTRILPLIQGITNVPSVQMLKQVAPQLFREKMERFTLDSTNTTVVEEWSRYFDGRDLHQLERRESLPSPERRAYLIGRVASGAKFLCHDYTDLNRQVRTLQAKTKDPLDATTIEHADVKGMLEVALPLEVGSIPDAIAYLPPVELSDLVSEETVREITAKSPDTYMGLPLEYYDAQPHVSDSSDVLKSKERIANLPDEAMALPDNRVILEPRQKLTSAYFRYPTPQMPLIELRRQARGIPQHNIASSAIDHTATDEQLVELAAQAIYAREPYKPFELKLYGLTPAHINQARSRATEMVAESERARATIPQLRETLNERVEHLRIRWDNYEAELRRVTGMSMPLSQGNREYVESSLSFAAQAAAEPLCSHGSLKEAEHRLDRLEEHIRINEEHL